MNRKALSIGAAIAMALGVVVWRFGAKRAPSGPVERIDSNAVTGLQRLSEAVDAAYASTVAAFAIDAKEDDHEALDARALADFEHLEELFKSVGPNLPPEAAKLGEAIAERFTAAQLQLMSFAINRKNRGLPDSAQTEMEIEDRDVFERESASLRERLQDALTSRKIPVAEPG